MHSTLWNCIIDKDYHLSISCYVPSVDMTFYRALFFTCALGAHCLMAHAAELQRIVSTSPSVTGILLAINAPVVASAAATPSRLTDSKGFFTQWASVADSRGVQPLYYNLQFDLEATIAAEPDLVVVSATGADSVAPHKSELQAQQLAVMVVDYSTHSWQEIATELGARSGHSEEAKKAIERFDAHVREVAGKLVSPAGKVSVVGYNLGGSYSIGRINSAQGRLLQALGFQVQELPEALVGQITRSSDFQFISRENLAAAITGDSVFLLSATSSDVQAFLADPVLANLPAVRNKRVYPLGPSSFRIDYYSGWQMADTVASEYR
jgi:iron complex transport system substrate-binding protein